MGVWIAKDTKTHESRENAAARSAFPLSRRATGNRESTRMDANPPLARRAWPVQPSPLAERGNEGGEVGTLRGAQTPRVFETLGVFSASPTASAWGDGEPRIHANGRESAPGPQVSHLTPGLRLPHEGVRSACGASGDGEPRILANGREFAPSPQASHLTPSLRLPHEEVRSGRPRRVTENRESTRMDANLPLARRLRTSPPAFGFPTRR